ncbi:MAG: hypothetical protein RLZZ450_3553 [Pseudomonadota bacterium]|jgi:hypothetical protein
MQTNRLGALGALLLFSLLVACSSSDKEKMALAVAKLAETCSLNSECADPLVCTFERCHMQCQNDRDCLTGERCVKGGAAGVCQLLNLETACIAGSSCRGSQVCGADGECRDSCSAATDCVGDQICGKSVGVSLCASRDPTRDTVDGQGNILRMVVASYPDSGVIADDAGGGAPVVVPGTGIDGGTKPSDAGRGGDASALMLSADLSHDPGSYTPPSVAQDSLGRPYIATRGTAVQKNVTYVYRLNDQGNSWEPVGGAVSPVPTYDRGIALAFNAADQLFVGWEQRNELDTLYEVKVRRYDNGAWVDVGQPIPIKYSDGCGFKLTVDGLGRPILVLGDYDAGAQRVNTFRFDGTDWQPLGEVPVDARPATGLELATMPNGEPTLVITARNRANAVEVWRFVSDRWLLLNTVGAGTNLALEQTQTGVVASWHDGASEQSKLQYQVARYDGTQWTNLALTPVDAPTWALSFTMFDDVLLAAAPSARGVSVYAHREGVWEPSLMRIAMSDTEMAGTFQLTARAGRAYLAYYTTGRVKLVRLNIP